MIDRETGEVRPAQIFVAVMGASNYTYAEATWSQRLADWIGAHVRALTFLGAVPEIVVPDNLKSAVRQAHRYEPQLNRTYQEWGEYYGVAILPARKARPRGQGEGQGGRSGKIPQIETAKIILIGPVEVVVAVTQSIRDWLPGGDQKSGANGV